MARHSARTARPAAVLIPPAFGLAGVNLHTWNGWGSVPYWNAFVANLEMHGQGTFFDPRLDDPVKFPWRRATDPARAGRKRTWSRRCCPRCRSTSSRCRCRGRRAAAYDRGRRARENAVHRQGEVQRLPRATAVHRAGLEHAHGRGDRHRQLPGGPRARTALRTAPLRGLWTHTRGGFYHDGRFPTLAAVIDHYDAHFALGLSAGEKSDLAQFLKSL
jgi:hypothetical protein